MFISNWKGENEKGMTISFFPILYTGLINRIVEVREKEEKNTVMVNSYFILLVNYNNFVLKALTPKKQHHKIY